MRPYVKWIVAVLLFTAVTANRASAVDQPVATKVTVELALPGQPVRHTVKAVDEHVVQPTREFVREHIVEPVKEELHKKAQRIEHAIERVEERAQERAEDRCLPPPPLAPSLTDDVRIHQGTIIERSVCTNCQRSRRFSRRTQVVRQFN